MATFTIDTNGLVDYPTTQARLSDYESGVGTDEEQRIAYVLERLCAEIIRERCFAETDPGIDDTFDVDVDVTDTQITIIVGTIT